METPDFDQIAQRLLTQVLWAEDSKKEATLAEQLRLVWNARGAADMERFFNFGRPPCPTFSHSAADDECKHCGWTSEAHDDADALRSLDR